MNDELAAAIKASAVRTKVANIAVITLEEARRLAHENAVSSLEVEIAALQSEVIPLRYERNIGTLGIDGQLKLLRSCVGVCGLGGLGGYIAVLLARFGIGRLILADGDVFEENNLNRHNLCHEADLGRPKAELAAERISAINSSLTTVTPHRFLKTNDMVEVFGEAALIVDALDSVSSRLALDPGCALLDIPMVHGAIAGNSGQVMTIFPGDPGLKAIYASGEDRGVEPIAGNRPP